MSYIGNAPPKLAQYGVESFNGGGTSFTLSKPATTATVLVFIDGVRQTPGDAYSVSGTTLTTTATTPSGTDNVTVQFLGDVVDFGEPSDDSVTSAKIVDGTIVNADINASAAIALSKLASDPSNASNLASGTVPTARLGSGTASSSTFLRGDQSWAEAGGGKVLQVVTATYNTETIMSTTTYTSSGFSLSITPASASNKVLVLYSGMCRVYAASSASGRWVYTRLYRVTDATQISGQKTTQTDVSSSISQGFAWTQMYCVLDSPSTTSAVEYRVDGKVNNATYHRLAMNNQSSDSTLTLLEIEG